MVAIFHANAPASTPPAQGHSGTLAQASVRVSGEVGRRKRQDLGKSQAPSLLGCGVSLPVAHVLLLHPGELCPDPCGDGMVDVDECYGASFDSDVERPLWEVACEV